MIENALDFEGLQSHTEKMKSYIKDEIGKETSRATNIENNKVDKTIVAREDELGLVKSGTDIEVDNDGNVSVKDNSHNHTLSNLSDLLTTADELNVLNGIIVKTSELNSLSEITENVQTQLDNKAPLESPALTGVPEAPTADLGTNTTQIATTEFVQNEIGNLGVSMEIKKIYSELTNPTIETTYTIPFHEEISSGYKMLLNNEGLLYKTVDDNTNTLRYSELILGSIKGISPSYKYRYGAISLLGKDGGHARLLASNGNGVNREIFLPNANGTLALLTSNVDSATKATQDANGNIITETYQTVYDPKAFMFSSYDKEFLVRNYDGSYLFRIMGSTNSVSIGGSSKATGNYSFASNYSNASGQYSHAEGYGATASGDKSHAEGSGTQALGDSSHAEGIETKAEMGSHAEGRNTYATYYSHAEGYNTYVYCYASHVEGSNCIAGDSSNRYTGGCSHAEGRSTHALGQHSHAEGYCTTALDNQHTQGHFNNTTTATKGSSAGTGTGSAFVIGNGTDANNTSNAFRVTFSGVAYAAGEYVTSGADYAEFFEWLDGNPNGEDRRGYFVTLEGDKIRIANPEDYIIGIISGQPSVVGNGDEDWMSRYILDEFGSYINEEFEYKEEVIEEKTGKFITITKTGIRRKQNPEYDSSKPYVQRKDRPEWDCVGMMGVLSVRDDGTCKVNGYCKVAHGGIATTFDSGYRVIKRVTDNIVKVVFK